MSYDVHRNMNEMPLVLLPAVAQLHWTTTPFLTKQLPFAAMEVHRRRKLTPMLLQRAPEVVTIDDP
jgi:hypothetical protein